MSSEHDRIRRLGPELRGKLFVIKMARRADKESLFCEREKLKTRLSSEHFVSINTKVALKTINARLAQLN